MNTEPGKTAGRFGKLVPNPKAKLQDQFHEVCRFKYFSGRTEESYWQWVVRFLKFHRGKAESRKQNRSTSKGETLRQQRPAVGAPFMISSCETGSSDNGGMGEFVMLGAFGGTHP